MNEIEKWFSQGWPENSLENSEWRSGLWGHTRAIPAQYFPLLNEHATDITGRTTTHVKT